MSNDPKHHHVDRRAADLIAVPGADDDLLSTRQLASWLGCSTQWVEIGRHRGYGPRFVQLGPRCIRYRRADVRAWLSERSHASTSEYAS
jgi:predicted DNA-binding transcriptional regulator AlpA